jgi:hypothetical protein
MDKRRWTLFYDLLVSPLYTALSFSEMDRTSHPVAKHLYLDMTRLGDVLLHEHCRVLEQRCSSSLD